MTSTHYNKNSEQKIIEKVYQLGLKYEQEKTGCSQCVMATLQEVFDLRGDNLFQAAFGLAGGVAGTCEGTCGALSGGILILNCLYGRNKEDFRRQGPHPLNPPNSPWEEKGLVLAKELVNRFIKEYGSITCKDIQNKIMGFKADFWTEEGTKIFEDAGGHKDKCPVVVAKAATWVAEIILKQKNKAFRI